MLTIGKPAQFGPDGMALRGQCSHESPGWQLCWFDRGTPPTPIWQGAYKTCRRLQASCRDAKTLEEARQTAQAILTAPARGANQPTDVYPTPAELSADREHGA
ncbi:MAG: hypothetical protein LBU23_08970, partial [Planctomycetota bacterium]|nr:hypothetical protein [Planctomycetota bacterium]